MFSLVTETQNVYSEHAMTVRIKAIGKKLRRLGANLWGDPKSPVNLRPTKPGMPGKRMTKVTGYGLQLAEKQKIKLYYDMLEKQFRRFFNNAMKKKGNTSEHLMGMLESRLQAFVYRMNWARTMASARQLVSHGHVMVNGRKVDIRSYLLKAGDVVELKEISRENHMIKDSIETSGRAIPSYIEVESPFKAKFVRTPKFAEIPFAVEMKPQAVIELLS